MALSHHFGKGRCAVKTLREGPARLENLAEGQGFEPWDALTSPVFKTGAFNHSATPPELAQIIQCFNTGTTCDSSFFLSLLY